MIDLRNLETYPDGVVPDEDVTLALKVLRTIRDVCLGPKSFDADGAVLLSHAHKFIVDACEQIDPANVIVAPRAVSSEMTNEIRNLIADIQSAGRDGPTVFVVGRDTLVELIEMWRAK